MDFKAKFTSRKFLAMVAGVVSGLAMAFGLDEAIISTVAGAVMSVASIIVYVMTEGKIDRERLYAAIEGVQSVMEIIEEREE